MQLDVCELKQIASQLESYITIKVVAETEDRLINKKELAKKLGCSDARELERKYLSRPGFPRIDPHVDGIRVTYSVKAVDKWIADNITTN